MLLGDGAVGGCRGLDTNLDTLGRGRVGIVDIVGVASVVMTLGGAVAVVETARSDDADFATGDVGFVISLQALAATASSLGIDFAAVDIENVVALDAGGSLRLQVGSVPFAIAGADCRGASAIDIDVIVAIDALGTCACRLDVQDAAVDIGVSAFDAVIGSIDIDVDALVEGDITLGVDAVVVGAIDFQRSRAAEQHVALAVDSALVAVVGCSAVSQFVGARQHDICCFLAVQIHCYGGGIGDIRAAEVQFVVRIALNGQRTIAGSAADNIANACHVSVVGCHMTIGHGDGDAIFR